MTSNCVNAWLEGDEMPSKDNFIEMAYAYMENELKEKGLYDLFVNNTEKFESKKDKLAIGFNYLDHFGK